MNNLYSSQSIRGILCPIAHFQQSFSNVVYDVYVYPLCKGGDLNKYMAKKRPTAEILKTIFLKISERNDFKAIYDIIHLKYGFINHIKCENPFEVRKET